MVNVRFLSQGFCDVAVEENKKGSADLDLLTLVFNGAGEMNRTPDLLITNELLYRLSYTG